MSPDPITIHNADLLELAGKKVRLNSGVLVRLEVEPNSRGAIYGAVEVNDPLSAADRGSASKPGRHWGYFEESDLLYTYRSQLLI